MFNLHIHSKLRTSINCLYLDIIAHVTFFSVIPVRKKKIMVLVNKSLKYELRPEMFVVSPNLKGTWLISLSLIPNSKQSKIY